MIYRYAKLDPMLWHPCSERIIIKEMLIEANGIVDFNNKRQCLKESSGWRYESEQSRYVTIFRGYAWFDKLKAAVFSPSRIDLTKIMGIY